MATLYVLNSQNFYVHLLASGDGAYVGSNATVYDVNQAVFGYASNHNITIAGDVYAGPGAGEPGIGTYLGAGGVLNQNNQLSVLQAGSSSGAYSGANITGFNSRVSNYGEISGRVVGLNMNGDGGDVSSIHNGGIIRGDHVGVHTSGNQALILKNTGMISGIYASFQDIGTGISQITNMGEMVGDVFLGEGSNYFDNRRGHVDGGISGGSGYDRFLPGADAEVFNGNGGTQDRIEFRSSASIRVSLDHSFSASGFAIGDEFSGIEDIVGSLSGDDVLGGDGLANRLFGMGGNDTLFGRAGVDSLYGYAGDDTLVGGLNPDNLYGAAGADTFRFNLLTELGDVVHDMDVDDAFAFASAAFGGLAKGVLAVAAYAENNTGLAADATDRFIYELDTDMLWYDRDGTGAAARVLVADIVPDFNMANTDIVIV